MKKLVLCVSVLVLCGGSVEAFDTVKVVNPANPSTPTSLSCKITDMTALKVSVEQRGAARAIPVSDIVSIAYEGESLALKNVRNVIVQGKFAEALELIGKVEISDTTRAEIAQDVEYYKALCASRLALAGEGKVTEAGKLMIAFLTAHPSNYHYLEGNEVVGDLLVANGSYAPAEVYYRHLAAAPWPDYQMRAGVRMARALMAQAKWPEAAQAFDGVVAINAKGEVTDELRGAALVGKARCLVEEGKADEAIKAAQDIIDKTDSELTDVQGSAYATLGLALRKSNHNKEAILAFLHVDLLYDSSPEAHAEALGNLVELWRTAEEPDRANQCLATLKEKYPNSPWVKKLGS